MALSRLGATSLFCWRVLRAIADHIDSTGIAPTWSEIAALLELSPKSLPRVEEALNRLERDGHIVRTPRKPRGICLTGKPLEPPAKPPGAKRVTRKAARSRKPARRCRENGNRFGTSPQFRARVLKIVSDWIAATGAPPTYNEICGALGQRDSSKVGRAVLQLAREGKLIHTPKRRRSLRLPSMPVPE